MPLHTHVQSTEFCLQRNSYLHQVMLLDHQAVGVAEVVPLNNVAEGHWLTMGAL